MPVTSNKKDKKAKIWKTIKSLIFNPLFGDQTEVGAQSNVHLILKHEEQIRGSKGPAHILAHLLGQTFHNKCTWARFTKV